MTKDRPILFSAPMVKALLAGTKTQTRRIVKHRRPWEVCEFGGKPTVMLEDENGEQWEHLLCPFGEPGDRLWVKETFTTCRKRHGDCTEYRATFEPVDGDDYKWKPSIFMPRALSRITLEVTAVRVEPLWAITEEDAKAEGVTPIPYDPEGDCWSNGTHRSAFEHLWGQINGWEGDPKARAPWSSNPWVWAVSFKMAGQVANG